MDGWRNDVLVVMGMLIALGVLWEIVGPRTSPRDGRSLVLMGLSLGLLATARRHQLMLLEVLSWMLVLLCLPFPHRGSAEQPVILSATPPAPEDQP